MEAQFEPLHYETVPLDTLASLLTMSMVPPIAIGEIQRCVERSWAGVILSWGFLTSSLSTPIIVATVNSKKYRWNLA